MTPSAIKLPRSSCRGHLKQESLVLNCLPDGGAYESTGLFQALSDPRIAKSLVAMHSKPAHPWTLESLANLAGMSRTSFANYFKEVMQVSPGKYLENLRLAIARQLVDTGIGLKQIATRTGYSSTSTLSRALGRNA